VMDMGFAKLEALVIVVFSMINVIRTLVMKIAICVLLFQNKLAHHVKTENSVVKMIRVMDMVFAKLETLEIVVFLTMLVTRTHVTKIAICVSRLQNKKVRHVKMVTFVARGIHVMDMGFAKLEALVIVVFSMINVIRTLVMKIAICVLLFQNKQARHVKTENSVVKMILAMDMGFAKLELLVIVVFSMMIVTRTHVTKTVICVLRLQNKLARHAKKENSVVKGIRVMDMVFAKLEHHATVVFSMMIVTRTLVTKTVICV